MPVLQGHKLAFLALKTCTKNIPVLRLCYGKFNIDLPCSAPDSPCVSWKEYYIIQGLLPADKVIGENISFNALYLRFYNTTSIQNSSHLLVLPSHHSSTHSPSNMRLISYREKTFSAPYSYKHISCLITLLLQLFTPGNHLHFCGHKYLVSVMET